MAGRSVTDFKLQVAVAAKKDIEELCAEDEELYDTLWMYIKELSTDQVLLEKLLEDRYGKLRHSDRFTHPIGVQQIGEFFRDTPPRDTWAWKFWEVENRGVKLRFVYMYLPRRRWFILLGVAQRDWNYAASHPFSDRIRADYDRFKRDHG